MGRSVGIYNDESTLVHWRSRHKKQANPRARVGTERKTYSLLSRIDKESRVEASIYHCPIAAVQAVLVRFELSTATLSLQMSSYLHSYLHTYMCSEIKFVLHIAHGKAKGQMRIRLFASMLKDPSNDGSWDTVSTQSLLHFKIRWLRWLLLLELLCWAYLSEFGSDWMDVCRAS